MGVLTLHKRLVTLHSTMTIYPQHNMHDTLLLSTSRQRGYAIEQLHGKLVPQRDTGTRHAHLQVEQGKVFDERDAGGIGECGNGSRRPERACELGHGELDFGACLEPLVDV